MVSGFQPMNNNLIKNNEYFKKRENFELSMDKKLSNYVSGVLKKEYTKEETIQAVQDKIKGIKNFEYVKNCFKDIVENRRKILLYCDYDNDGLSSGSEMTYFLDMFEVPYEIVFPSRKDDGYGLKVINLTQNKKVFDFLESNKDNKEPVYVCSLDNGINNDEVSDILKKRGLTYCSIDHHQPRGEYKNDYCMNPHLNKENVKEEENLCTGMLVYGFCLNMFHYLDINKIETIFSTKDGKNNMDIKKISQLKDDFKKSNIDLAIISTLSDYMRLDGINRAVVKHYSEKILEVGRSGIKDLINGNSFFQKAKIYETLNFNVISLLNAVGRLENMETAYHYLRGSEGSITVEDLININENKKVMVSEVIKEIDENMENILNGGKTVVYSNDVMEGGIASIISTRIAMQMQAVTLIGHTNGYDKIRYSIRSPFYTHILEAEFAKIGYLYKGHNVAGVCEISLHEKEEFEQKVRDHFNSQSLDLDKNVILDTIEDGDLITVGLLNKIYSYGPYGAGLKEPVFRVKGDFVKGSNGLYLGTSKSGKTQTMNIMMGNSKLLVSNKTGKPLTENDIKGKNSLIVTFGYPYGSSGKVNINLLEIE